MCEDEIEQGDEAQYRGLLDLLDNDAAPILVGDFRWHDVDWWVVYWPDEAEFDVVREEIPYTWRGTEVDEREP